MEDTDLIKDNNHEDIILPVKKKRGRKPKNPNAVKEVKEKKKRGRKPKIVNPDEVVDVQRVRKRGRRPRYPVKSISEIREKFKNIDDKIEFEKSNEVINDNHSQTHVPFGNLNIIVHKPPEIDTSELRKLYNVGNENKTTEKYSSESEEEIEEVDEVGEVEIEEIDESVVCSKCNCENKGENNTLEYVKVEKKKVNKQLYKFSEKLDECGKWAEKSNVLCWWCCHNFTTIPVPSVISYEERRKRYNLKGIFCSWECSYAFTSNKSRNMGCFFKLFREWTGEKMMNIKCAPSPYILKSFGGHMDITEFRKSPYINRKVFLSENNRMSYINQDILEIYTEMERKKKNKLKISRKKPLKTTEMLFETMSIT